MSRPDQLPPLGPPPTLGPISSNGVADDKAAQYHSMLSFLTDNAIATTLTDYYTTLFERRKSMGLENPGTVDNIAREVQKDVLLSNFMFSGLRCDIQKIFSVAPLFRLQHGFAMGSQAPPPWQLMALYGTPKVCDQPSALSSRRPQPR